MVLLRPGNLSVRPLYTSPGLVQLHSACKRADRWSSSFRPLRHHLRHRTNLLRHAFPRMCLARNVRLLRMQSSGEVLSLRLFSDREKTSLPPLGYPQLYPSQLLERLFLLRPHADPASSDLALGHRPSHHPPLSRSIHCTSGTVCLFVRCAGCGYTGRRGCRGIDGNHLGIVERKAIDHFPLDDGTLERQKHIMHHSHVWTRIGNHYCLMVKLVFA